MNKLSVMWKKHLVSFVRRRHARENRTRCLQTQIYVVAQNQEMIRAVVDTNIFIRALIRPQAPSDRLFPASRSRNRS